MSSSSGSIQDRMADASPTERTSIMSTDSQPALTIFRWRCRRRLLAYMAFLGFANMYGLRANLSVAIVAMTSNQTYTSGNETIFQPAEFDWPPLVQGIVLSSFFYGYIVTQIPGGYMAAKYGGKRVFGLGVAATSILTLLTPVLARASLYLLVAARVAEGLFQGMTYPAIHALWSRWAPPLERTRLATVAFSGSYFGTVFATEISGYLYKSMGWPSIFYVFGLLSLIWVIVWSYIISETPQGDPYISHEELELLRSTLGAATDHVKYVPIPWKRMMMSLPVWAIIIAHFCQNWGFYTLLTELPTIMTDILKTNLDTSAKIAGVPYMIMGIMVLLGGLVADKLRVNGTMSTRKVRTLFNCGGFVFQALFLVLSANTRSKIPLMIYLMLAMGFGGLAWSGFGVNHLDIASPYASILMGISNTFATLPGMISPIVTGHVVAHKTPEEWEVVFYIAAAIYLVGALLYAIFASGEEQYWAQPAVGLLNDDSNTEDFPYGDDKCD